MLSTFYSQARKVKCALHDLKRDLLNAVRNAD